MKSLVMACCLVVCGWQSTLAQNYPRVDSLKKALTTQGDDASRFQTLTWIFRFYVEINVDSSMVYAQRAYQLSLKSNSLNTQAQGLQGMASVSWRMGNSATALELYFKALRILESLQDTATMSILYSDIGNAYSSQNDQPKAIEYYLKSLTSSPPLGAHAGTDLTRARALMNIGILYFNLNKTDSAIYFAQVAYRTGLQIEVKKYLPVTLKLLGDIQHRSGQTALAFHYYQQGIKDALAYSNLTALGETYLSLAVLHQEKNSADSAYQYASKAFGVAQQVHNIYSLQAASRFLNEFFKRGNRLDSAYKYQEIVLAAKDSLLNLEKIRQVQNLSFNEQLRQRERQAAQVRYRNQVVVSVLLAGLAVFLLIGMMLWRTNRNKQKANLLLREKNEQIAQTLLQLQRTQTQLVQAEKMAALGELTAGIAHEIQNPLNFVNNFSEVSVELVSELETERGKPARDEALERELLGDLKQNLSKIHHHGKRADSIVKGMLQHSRATTGQKQPTDLNSLAEEYLRLSYHGLRAKDSHFDASLLTDFDLTMERVDVVPQEMGRVLLNLFNNAFYATQQQKALLNGQYQPQVTVHTRSLGEKVEIRVKDNGVGIPAKAIDKIFQPFFTTKPTGQGTGLGLSLSYDIITKGYGGELKVVSKDGEGAEFIVTLPLQP